MHNRSQLRIFGGTCNGWGHSNRERGLSIGAIHYKHDKDYQPRLHDCLSAFLSSSAFSQLDRCKYRCTGVFETPKQKVRNVQIQYAVSSLLASFSESSRHCCQNTFVPEQDQRLSSFCRNTPVA